MIQITGTYHLERNENLDQFYSAAGVPWIARKMMLVTSPTMHVVKEKDDSEEDYWLFKTVTFVRTIEQSFKIDEPFEEEMPSGDVYNTVVTMDGDNTFILKSTSEEKGDFQREYDFTDDGLVVTLKHPSGVQAKRYFKRTEG